MTYKLDQYFPESQVAVSYRPSYSWDNIPEPIRALELEILPVDAVVETLFIWFSCGTIVGVENPLMYPRATNIRRGTQCLNIPTEACTFYTKEQTEEIMYKGVERVVL